jgi:hypothetical protein
MNGATEGLIRPGLAPAAMRSLTKAALSETISDSTGEISHPFPTPHFR